MVLWASAKRSCSTKTLERSVLPSARKSCFTLILAVPWSLLFYPAVYWVLIPQRTSLAFFFFFFLIVLSLNCVINDFNMAIITRGSNRDTLATKTSENPCKINALVLSPMVKCQYFRRENVFSCAQKGFYLSDHNFRVSIVFSFSLSLSLWTC